MQQTAVDVRDGSSEMHQIITNEEGQLVVWPGRSRVPSGWRLLGKSGSKQELKEYLRLLVVETTPVPLIIGDGRKPDSEWGPVGPHADSTRAVE